MNAPDVNDDDSMDYGDEEILRTISCVVTIKAAPTRGNHNVAEGVSMCAMCAVYLRRLVT